ncbi:hypothetical protein OsI_29535 [Oryza sativa Indica Group]|uniref:FAD-binding FR-type domain-containing protein n=1 Tax=Oryza sativa subsp. indica TaxID=39946 RepID=B8BBJ7_ORYSI|nr:hypothetical protein OsI_29535 [Oryza sativa Indica Group]
MLAYMQNGEPLLPDHGFPVRAIIPGCIGGRMVKWVKRIIVTTAESDNYYHYKDNRVLPSHVDAELANADAWWYKPEYIINELNVNSVITTPGHDEILPINGITTQRGYTMKGYAYSVSALFCQRKRIKLAKLALRGLQRVIQTTPSTARPTSPTSPPSARPSRRPAPVALSSPRDKVPCQLVDKKELSRDVRLFRFALPSSDQVLGLPVGKHIFVCASIEGKLCMRAYTPTSMVDEVGHFDLLIKVYFKNEHPKFPDGGLMTQYLDSLPVGAYIDVKGPLGHVEYTGRGEFVINGKPRNARRLAMIAGGSGITPMYQVIQSVLRDQPEDTTEMHLVYANRTEDDILLRDELDRWAAEYPDRLKVWYVIDQVKRPEEGWKYGVGFVTEEVLREHVPEGGDDTLALACGPPPMIKFAVSPNLEKMKYDMANSFIVF